MFKQNFKKILISLLVFGLIADCIMHQTFWTLQLFLDTAEVNLEVLYHLQNYIPETLWISCS